MIYEISAVLPLFAIFFLASAGHANEIEVVEVKPIKQGKSWQFRTTLRHADTGWGIVQTHGGW
ncbi:MAG: hypothetical protein BMS9Abin11_1545 [Gammaproteobacteria bacterium]|nr:MAG: hypothetical protein BMS9Abin11_1545 [Gammaproteobacteria bacterium]